MPIKATRALVTGALDGSLRGVSFRTDPYFGFAVPTSVPGIEPHLLYPMKTWKDKAAFDQTARKLVRMFQENFVKHEKHVDADVRSAAPEVRLAAELRGEFRLDLPILLRVVPANAGIHNHRPLDMPYYVYIL